MFRWIKHAKQRVFNDGIDDTMTFSFDMTHAKMTAKMLRQYLKHADDLIDVSKEDRKWIKGCIKAFEDYGEQSVIIAKNEDEVKLMETDFTAFAKMKNKRCSDVRNRMKKLYNKNYSGLWW